MKNPKRILTGFAATLWMFMGPDVMGQGSLTPPGAPGETMHTLEEVYERTDPRTPISSLPYTISEPGSYYVTGNLSSTGDGIIIESSGVTVDLMGFSLTGDGTSSYPDPDYGIKVNGSTNAVIDRVVIKGGSISGFHDGLYFKYMNNSRIKELVVSGNTSDGVRLWSYQGQCVGNTITDCTISGNTDRGVFLSGLGGQCDGNIISDCAISENGYGVYLNGQIGQCDGNTITDCTISGNGTYGIYLDGSESGQCNGNTITGSTISGGGHIGVSLWAVNGQCKGNIISDCAISGNENLGVYLYGNSGQCNGNTITDCTISENRDYGVYLYGNSGQCDGNTLQGNSIKENVDCGIFIFEGDGNRVEDNNVWGTTGEGNTYGIRTRQATDNLILKNSCVGNGTNYVLDSDDTYGPIVDVAGELGTADGASHPWANFSR